jgi:hypothetical protein
MRLPFFGGLGAKGASVVLCVFLGYTAGFWGWGGRLFQHMLAPFGCAEGSMQRCELLRVVSACGPTVGACWLSWSGVR